VVCSLILAVLMLGCVMKLLPSDTRR